MTRIEELVGRADGTHYRWRCCVGLEPCASGPWLDEAGARLGKAEHEQWHADEERRATDLEEYEEAACG